MSREKLVISSGSYKNAPTQTIDVGGTRFAYRRLGADTGVPVIFLHYLAAVLDNWDPRVIDGIAARHPVIAFDNRGVGASRGSTPKSVAAMAQDAVAFIRALGFDQVDLLGFSLGGMVSQVIVQEEPQLVSQACPRRHRSRRRRGHRQGHADHPPRDAQRRADLQGSEDLPLLHPNADRPDGSSGVPQATEGTHR